MHNLKLIMIYQKVILILTKINMEINSKNQSQSTPILLRLIIKWSKIRNSSMARTSKIKHICSNMATLHKILKTVFIRKIWIWCKQTHSRIIQFPDHCLILNKMKEKRISTTFHLASLINTIVKVQVKCNKA